MEEKIIEKINELSIAIDIAINTFEKCPDKKLDQASIAFLINSLYESRLDLQKKEYQNTRGVKQIETELFTMFNEGHGPHVDYFWKRIKENNLSFQQKDMLAAILKRKRIKNHEEYDFVTDVIVAYAQEGRINEIQEVELKRMIDDFEKKAR